MDFRNETELGLTAIESVSILQISQLLKTGMQDPCSVTRNRHSQRLSVWSYRPRCLLAPVERAEIYALVFLVVRLTVYICKNEMYMQEMGEYLLCVKAE